MTPLLEAVLISGVYVAGCLTGHRVVTVVVAYTKAAEARAAECVRAAEQRIVAQLEALHEKADTLIAKRVNTIHPLSKTR